MNRRRFLLPALLALVGPLLLAAGPAGATGSSLTTTSGVLWPDCKAHSFTVTVDNTGGTSWDLQVNAVRPDGTTSDYAYLQGTAPSAQRTSYVTLCSWEGAGTWRLQARLRTFDASYDIVSTTTSSTTFAMRQARTRTSASVDDTTAAMGQTLTFRGRSTVEHPDFRYYGAPQAQVALQRWNPGTAKWDVIGRKDAGTYGWVAFSLTNRFASARAYRLVTLQTTEHASSVSPKVTVY